MVEYDGVLTRAAADELLLHASHPLVPPTSDEGGAVRREDGFRID
jgi:hypothetical protein